MADANAKQFVGSMGTTAGRFASNSVSRATLSWIFFAQGVSILPLFYFLPLWLAAIWACAVLIRIQIFRGIWPFPGTVIKLVFSVCGMSGLYLSYGGNMGVDPMIGLLLLAFILKLIEVRSRQDVLIVLYVGFVTVAAQLLLSPNFWMSVYALISCGVLLAALQSVFQHRKVSVKRRLWSGFSILFQALPVMMVLFVLMPRLGQLWAVPSLSHSGKTGFSDSMSPGDFSDLIQSDDIAFRVTFEGGRLPPANMRYWRGLVLEQFDGKRWQRFGANWLPLTADSKPSDHPAPSWNLQAVDNQGSVVPIDAATNDKHVYRYSVLMEPHNYQWLFSLMAPLEVFSPTERTLFLAGGLVATTRPVTAITRYESVSLIHYRFGPSTIEHPSLERNLKLPNSGNERARALARQWRESAETPSDIVRMALDYYSRDFVYTLRPPLLGDNPIDDFLFSTRRGFCEHFSSSFVYLMRAAGIPARVVLGYQGGEYREQGEYLVIRQSDAHAWVEVWLKNKGWTRVDPTAAVSPLRIERSLYEVVDRNEASLVGGALLRVKALAWLANAKLKLEMWDYIWQTRVMSYDDDSKQGLLKKLLGSTEAWRVALLFLLGVGAPLACYYLIGLLRHPRKRHSPELRSLLSAFRKLERAGFPRRYEETPQAYCARIAQLRPELEASLGALVGLYYRIAYRGETVRLPELRKAARQFSAR